MRNDFDNNFPRFFVFPEDFENERVLIRGQEARHLHKVLRLKSGNPVMVVDGLGKEGLAVVNQIHKDYVSCQINRITRYKNEPFIKISLAQALPKFNKMDEVINMGTQLGMVAFFPMITAHCDVKYAKGKLTAKLPRWKKIAMCAIKQCAGAYLPVIHPVVSLDEIFKLKVNYDLMFLAENKPDNQRLHAVLKKNKNIKSILLMIGPEGGFSIAEMSDAKSEGIETVSLGKRRLRTELAGIVGAAMILGELEEW